MDHGGLRGFNRVVDNVSRRQAFERAHPAVTIRHHERPRWYWSAVWCDDGCRREITDGELGGLLDRLDAELG